jgi:hypothetical protein
MTFTRLSDDATLTPVMVFGPYEQTRRSRQIVRELAESGEVRVAWRPPSRRRGTYMLLFSTYAAALSAQSWFLENSEYDFEGPTVGEGVYEVVDGYIVEVPPTTDAGFSMRFVLDEEEPTINQNDPMWELRVSYQEVPTS